MKGNVTLTVLVALASALYGTREARSCSTCMCGSPTPPGYLLTDLGGRFGYGVEDRYLSKSNVLDDAVGEERQVEHRLSGIGIFRARANLALQARVPVVFKTNTRAELGQPHVSSQSHGLGDIELMARLDAARFGSITTGRKAIAVIGVVTAPTGNNDAKDASGERLDAHLQPGTGAWSGSAGVVCDVSIRSSAYSVSLLGRVNGTNAHGYRYGNALLFNAGYARDLPSGWQAAFELNGRTAGQDWTEEGTYDPNSGGAIVYAAPSLRWTAIHPLILDLLVQIPIAKELHGDQHEKTAARLALTWWPR